MQAAGIMLIQVPEEPWNTVCADFFGPLPRSNGQPNAAGPNTQVLEVGGTSAAAQCDSQVS